LKVKLEVHALQAPLFEGPSHSILCVHLTVQHQKASPARTRDLASCGTVFSRQLIALIDEARGETWSETAFLLPGVFEEVRELIQVAVFKTPLHIKRYWLDMMQRLQDCPVLFLGRSALMLEYRSRFT